MILRYPTVTMPMSSSSTRRDNGPPVCSSTPRCALSASLVFATWVLHELCGATAQQGSSFGYMEHPSLRLEDRRCIVDPYESVDCGCCVSNLAHFVETDSYYRGQAMTCRDYIRAFDEVPDECGLHTHGGRIPEDQKIWLLQKLAAKKSQGATHPTTDVQQVQQAEHDQELQQHRDHEFEAALNHTVVDLVSFGPSAEKDFGEHIWPRVKCENNRLWCECPPEFTPGADFSEDGSPTADAERVCAEEQRPCALFSKEEVLDPKSTARRDAQILEAYAELHHSRAAALNPLRKEDIEALPQCKAATTGKGNGEHLPTAENQIGNQKVKLYSTLSGDNPTANSQLQSEELAKEESQAGTGDEVGRKEENTGSTTEAEAVQAETPSGTAGIDAGTTGTTGESEQEEASGAGSAVARTGLGFYRCRYLSPKACENHFIRYPVTPGKNGNVLADLRGTQKIDKPDTFASATSENFENNGFYRCQLVRSIKNQVCPGTVLPRTLQTQRNLELQYSAMRNAFHPEMIMHVQPQPHTHASGSEQGNQQEAGREENLKHPDL
ncbi:unnamed protein product [Amoebophrya sp. A25]|nr:unnamed protein product [Amoebophrya sp. A25]|eukprot:GSA25T00015687001.1